MPFFVFLAFLFSHWGCILLFFLCVFFVISFLLELLRLKTCFHRPSRIGKVLFFTLEFCVKTKRIKLILHLNLLKAFIFEHGLTLKLFFLKWKSQVIKLICCVIENISMKLKEPELLAPIINTIVTLGRLGLPWFTVAILMTQIIINKRTIINWCGSNFLEFLQFRVGGGDNFLYLCLKMWQKLQKLHWMIWFVAVANLLQH